MLAKVCLKRFRFVLYAALFFLITLHITDRTNSGLIATLCIWFALPLAFIAFVWWIYACIRDIVRFFKSGAVPEDAPTWAERAVWWVQDELAEIASLDDRGKVRFFLFRVGGVALAALGLVLIVRDSIVLGTMLDGAREEPAEDVNAQIAQFEEQVSLQRTWQGEAGSPMFYEVQENKASAFAAGTSDFLVRAIREVTLSLTDFFTALTR